MMRSDWMFGLLAMQLGLIACQKETGSQSQVSAIIGDDSLHPVIPGEGSESNVALEAIARLSGGCTAFHLGQGVVATAGHCLPAPTGKLAEAVCSSYTMQWYNSTRTSRCLRYLAYRNDAEADYALIEVDPAPATQLDVSDPSWAPPSQAAVFGFPQERGELSTSASCTLKAGQAEIFFHDCDTLPGVSGSPVLDAETQRVIGIHNGEAEAGNYGTWIQAIGDIQNWRRAVQETPAMPSALTFGPFGNSEVKLLATLPKLKGSHVRFLMRLDIEEGFDQVAVTDGSGRRREYSGKKVEELDLPTPVSIVVTTDYSGTSNQVQLEQVESY